MISLFAKKDSDVAYPGTRFDKSSIALVAQSIGKCVVIAFVLTFIVEVIGCKRD